ncbi:MAG: cytochrome c oxidase subunit II [Gemmatimonadetes bacterium]|nr:cytochrome c oxidase subunit II [Gemmatimonadota bacterium]
MKRTPRRRLASALVVAAAGLTLAACGQEYPNSTFLHNSEINTDIIALWDRILFMGTLVFIVVEALLIFTIFRFRAKPGAPMPKQVHGNHTLEIVWTLIPVLILIPIAVPTVKTIFKTQAPAVSDALQVEVYGHQWWWEFRYPEYGVTTANELYLPAGRTVNFTLRTVDVIHSFWAPGLAGKRDLISNKTNHMWYTPDAKLVESAFNGFCTEYCGESHANMRFRVFTTTPENFESWAAHQNGPAALSPGAMAAQAAADSATVRAVSRASVVPAPAPAPAPTMNAGYVFPADKLPAHTVPKTPIPARITFDDNLLAQGDASRGHDLMTNLANLGKAPCMTCHVIRGEMALITDAQATGPSLTHFGSRHTFGGGLFPTNASNLARWVKNAQIMKPGTTMNTFGIGEYSPLMKGNVTAGLSDAEIADIVAYLLSLK